MPILCSVTFGAPMQVLRHTLHQGEVETDGEHYRAGGSSSYGTEMIEDHAHFADRARTAVIALRDI